jgi:ubiquitin-protein ligase
MSLYLFLFLSRSGSFLFSFAVPNAYPHEPPKVKCLTKVYHPNIDLEGNVCLNILREDWKPVLTITSIVYGLNFLFLVRKKTIKKIMAVAETPSCSLSLFINY